MRSLVPSELGCFLASISLPKLGNIIGASDVSTSSDDKLPTLDNLQENNQAQRQIHILTHIQSPNKQMLLLLMCCKGEYCTAFDDLVVYIWP